MGLERVHIERFRAAIAQRSGLRIDDNRLDELADLLRKRMAELRIASVEHYLSAFKTSRQELRAVASQITISETYFFRIPDHFRALAEVALPDRIKVQTTRRQLAILSAGCSSGEEPYSIAMVTRENLHNLPAWQIAIQGVDINPVVLARARQGCYSEWSLREMPPYVRDLYFRANSKQFHLDENIRQMVSFAEGNLLDLTAGFWQREAYDVIFFRNVLMYFGPEAAEAVVSRVFECLRPGGYLFLGPAETLRGLSSDFHLCHTHNSFYYQRREQPQERLQDAMAPQGAPVPQSLMSLAVPSKTAEISELESSWFDNIRQASERIENLARGPLAPPAQKRNQPVARKAAATAGPAWDVELALELLRQDRFADALAIIQHFPSASQTDRDVQLLRAVLLANAGEVSEAERACKLLLAADDLNAGAHYLMALCREHAGDRRGALEHDRIALYLDPQFAMPHLHLGLLAKRDAQCESACQELKQASVLLSREESSRILLFGGGFSREALIEMCRRELRACGGAA